MGDWEVEFFEDAWGRVPVRRWMENELNEIQSIYTSSESRPRSSHQKILLRVFMSFHGKKLVLLLHGYDKGKNDSKKKQQEEIEIARRRLRAWKRTNLG